MPFLRRAGGPSIFSFLLVALFLAALLTASAPATAAEAAPGDACTTANQYIVSGGPELSGVGHLMVCAGSVWVSVLDYNALGQITKVGAQTCTTNQILKFDGTKWACAADNAGSSSLWAMAKVTTSATANTATYSAPGTGTAGPAVTVATDTTALVTLTAKMSNATAASRCKMGVVVSGATTLAASDSVAIQETSVTGGYVFDISGTFYMTGLTAGNNTFTAQYANGTGSTVCTYTDRHISVTTTGGETTCADTSPDAVTFTNLTGQAASTLVTSNIVQITGMSCPLTTSITSPTNASNIAYRICDTSNCSAVAQDWTNAQSVITSGQYVQLRMKTSAVSDTYPYQLATFNAGAGAVGWYATVGSTCTTTLIPGTPCTDGTIFAGIAPDGHRLYTTRCSLGYYFDGFNCNGFQPLYMTWGNGKVATLYSGVINSVNGLTNTNSLVGISNADSPYGAANYCYNYDDGNGNTDWYLPAAGELSIVIANAAAYPGVTMLNNQYWASTEFTNNPAEAVMIAQGTSYYNGQKASSFAVLCIRRT